MSDDLARAERMVFGGRSWWCEDVEDWSDEKDTQRTDDLSDPEAKVRTRILANEGDAA